MSQNLVEIKFQKRVDAVLRMVRMHVPLKRGVEFFRKLDEVKTGLKLYFKKVLTRR